MCYIEDICEVEEVLIFAELEASLVGAVDVDDGRN